MFPPVQLLPGACSVVTGPAVGAPRAKPRTASSDSSWVFGCPHFLLFVDTPSANTNTTQTSLTGISATWGVRIGKDLWTQPGPLTDWEMGPSHTESAHACTHPWHGGPGGDRSAVCELARADACGPIFRDFAIQWLNTDIIKLKYAYIILKTKVLNIQIPPFLIIFLHLLLSMPMRWFAAIVSEWWKCHVIVAPDLWCHTGSLKSIKVGLFTPWKPTNATNQSLSCCFFGCLDLKWWRSGNKTKWKVCWVEMECLVLKRKVLV